MHTVHLLSTDLQKTPSAGLRLPARVFSPYGVSSGTQDILTGFTGIPRDPVTDLYHLGNGRRSYSPRLRRFIAADTLSPFGEGGLNAYAYCGGDPVNRSDPNGQFWLSSLLSGISVLSSSVTAGGAIIRTARNVVNRLDAQANRTIHMPPSTRSRIGNTSFFYTGAMGVGGTVSSGIEQGWIGNVLTTNGRRLGLGNAVGNITGGLFSNTEAAQAVWRGIGRPGVSAGRVAWETAYEVTGLGLIGEGASYVWQGVRSLGGRIASSFQAARGAWRNWGRGTQSPSAPPDIEMNNIRGG